MGGQSEGETEGKLEFNHTRLRKTPRARADPLQVRRLSDRTVRPMKFQPDRPEGVNVIHAYTRTSVSVNGQEHTRSLLVPPTGALIDWPVSSLEALTEADFQPILDARPEVLILGTGTALRFVKPALMRHLMAARIGVETMDTAAACRTYNILVGEGRQVMAALLIGA